jgi:pimeloyl-ACP methyl ester carboxylesterase
VKERALLLGAEAPVVGVVTVPEDLAPGRPAFLLLNSGLVHHIGPGRLYVRIARTLAAQGCLSVRLDHRGIGDSDQRDDDVPFAVGACREISDVMDELRERWGVERFVLLGICSGAEFAYAIAQEDERVAGTVLINGGGQAAGPEFQQQANSRRLTQRYLGRSIFRPEAWIRALTGRIEYGTLARVLSNRFTSLFTRRPEIDEATEAFGRGFARLVERGVETLLINSSDDDSIVARDMILGDSRDELVASGRLQLEAIERTDHTFTLWERQQRLIEVLVGWLGSRWPTSDAASAPVAEREDLVEKRRG